MVPGRGAVGLCADAAQQVMIFFTDWLNPP